jgi:GNAT superfamily N-acetyltransferase
LRLDRARFDAELGASWPLEQRERVLEELWRRGAPGDVSAIGFLLRRFPELKAPSFLRLPPDVRDRSLRLQCCVDEAEIEEALPLLESLYWLAHLSRDEIRVPLERSTARVAARDGRGNIVAFARAVSDGKCAWIYDVAVAEHLRGERLGAALMGVLLDHPGLRSVRHVRLSTRDAMPFYRRLGFSNLEEAPRYPWKSTEMIRSRKSPIAAGA